MPKTIKDYGVAICRGVRATGGMVYMPWNWRLSFIGRQGALVLLESERKNPGGRFLYFEGADWSEERQDFDDWRLRTGYGDEIIEGTMLTFRTRNSVYTFEIVESAGSDLFC